MLASAYIEHGKVHVSRPELKGYLEPMCSDFDSDCFVMSFDQIQACKDFKCGDRCIHEI